MIRINRRAYLDLLFLSLPEIYPNINPINMEAGIKMALETDSFQKYSFMLISD